MKNKYNLLFSFLLLTQSASAVEVALKGVLDFRLSANDSSESYANGGFGKFGLDEGTEFSLSQLGAEAVLSWDGGVSFHAVGNGYKNNNYDEIGLTEAFFKYRSLPNDSGYRWQNRTGIFYPKISLENHAIAWASQNTLNSSMINTWIGEEIRVLGSELMLTRLGKYNDSKFDVSMSLTAFDHNDPAGSLLSWHGWTIGNEQTLWGSKKPLTPFPARLPGGELQDQNWESDPFKIVDSNIGYHVLLDLKRHKKGHFSVGYYDNNGTPYVIDNGQYSWRTQFFHAGGVWSLDKQTLIRAQYLKGYTLMQHPDRRDAVNNDYSSGYLSLTHRLNKHSLTGRVEAFSVVDNDDTMYDNNDENGVSLTLNYQFRVSKGWFFSSEYNVIKSHRPSRVYLEQPINLIEQQFQLSMRYFFSNTL